MVETRSAARVPRASVVVMLSLSLALGAVFVAFGGARDASAATTINVPANQPTIQAAVDAAVNGDTVVVSPGTYFEHIDFTGKAIEVKSASGAGVTIIDGSGAGGGDVVKFNHDETNASILRGFTVRNCGFACSGIGTYGASPTIASNFVRDNTSGNGIKASGGAPIITGNLITANTSCLGGGVDLEFSGAQLQSNIITNNTLNCVGGFVGGAGVRIIGPGTASVVSNVIDGNDAGTSPGGGIGLFGPGSPTIRNNVIRHNKSGEGGGIRYDEGGVQEATPQTVTIVQNIVADNTASQAGGLALRVPSQDQVIMVGNTVANNGPPPPPTPPPPPAPAADGVDVASTGNGLVLFGQYATSQLWDNIVADGLSCDPGSGSASPNATANNAAAFLGNCASAAGNDGNISASPHFLNAPAGDYHLQAASPSIDTGNNSAPLLPATDLDGKTRIVGSAVDQGAIEFVPGPADPTGEFTPLTPARILDTRNGTGRSGSTAPLGNASSFTVQITGQGGVPATGVSAVVLNATVTQPTGNSYLTVWPAGIARPVLSNLNYVPGQTVPNLVTVGIGTGGKVNVYNNAGTTHVIFDVVGYYASSAGPFGSRYHGVNPSRFFDTRIGSGGVAMAPVGPGGVLKFTVTGKNGVPATGVTAVAMNVTLTQPTASGHIIVYPDDVSAPLASNLNFVPGLTAPNLVVMRVPASGVIDFFNSAGSTHLIADVVGYYDGDKTTNGGRFIALTPSRRFDTRIASPFPPPGSIPPNNALVARMTGISGLPASGVGSVVVNVTATQPTASGFITVWPTDAPLPVASNLNFVPGQTVPNLVMVRVSTVPPNIPNAQGPGWIGFYNLQGSTHLIADVFGYFTAPFNDVTGQSEALDGPTEGALPVSGGG